MFTLLATRDDVEARMKQPGLLSELLDEFIRLELPVSIMTRTFTNVEGRDEARFEHTNSLDLNRHPNLHADFRLGIHRRLRVAFARIQIAIAFEELLAAATNFRLAPMRTYRAIQALC